MLALRTGWTDRQIADEVADDFRRACHQALYDELMVEPLAEAREIAKKAAAIDITTIPTSERATLRHAAQLASDVVRDIRATLGLGEEPADG